MKRSRQQWEELIDELEESGEGVTEFAAHHGLNARTLAWWRWRIGSDRAKARVRTPSFLPVVVHEMTPPVPRDHLWDDVEVRLANGVFLRLGGLTATGLREVVDVVGAS